MLQAVVGSRPLVATTRRARLRLLALPIFPSESMNEHKRTNAELRRNVAVFCAFVQTLRDAPIDTFSGMITILDKEWNLLAALDEPFRSTTVAVHESHLCEPGACILQRAPKQNGSTSAYHYCSSWSVSHRSFFAFHGPPGCPLSAGQSDFLTFFI